MNAPLSEYYDAEDKGRDWHLYCKVCGKGWALKKDSTAIGNVLHLLNHARSHTSKRMKRTHPPQPG